MPEKLTLPAEVHDHFARANVLHGYVQKDFGEATKHALEAGEELLAAKAGVPHGRWEEECKRIFDGSLRTAQFYMQFTRHVSALPKAQKYAVLLLEGTLDGAAKAAKKAIDPKPKKPPAPAPPPPSQGDEEHVEDAPESPETPAEPEGVDYGKCPNCGGPDWDEDDEGVSCSKCHHPHGEPAGDPDEDRLKTQRQKTVKTGEALMRAFDDLQGMWARPEHTGPTKWTAEEVHATLADMGVISACKGLLKIAKGWK